MFNHYNSNLRKFAHELRNESVSRAEKYIWKALLSRNQMGIKFKRQRPIHYFIVDFFAAEIGLIIEIDGNSHSNKGEYDAKRQNILTELGFHVVRFSEGMVLNNIDNVENQIRHAIYCLKEAEIKSPPKEGD
ncbi:MAG: endonuclease domain-containing protein [Bacteroidetes bacterium]|nr:endonuclease domain-containing protein [Bacteroidota bacterium]